MLVWHLGRNLMMLKTAHVKWHKCTVNHCTVRVCNPRVNKAWCSKHTQNSLHSHYGHLRSKAFLDDTPRSRTFIYVCNRILKRNRFQDWTFSSANPNIRYKPKVYHFWSRARAMKQKYTATRGFWTGGQGGSVLF